MRSAYAPIMVVVCTLSIHDCSISLAQNPKAPDLLTLEQVEAAFHAVRSFGCNHASYQSGERSKFRSSFRLALAAIPVDAAAASRLREYFGPQDSDSYALGFPSKTGDADLARLAISLRRLPFLGTVDLGGTRITEAGLRMVVEIPDVTALFFDRTDVGDGGVKELEKASQLTWLDLSKTRVTNKGVSELVRAKGLRVLRLADNLKITDEALLDLTRLVQLRSLCLAGTGISLQSAPDLSKWKSLRRLDLSHCPIDDAALKGLATLKSLEELNLSATNVTGAGLAELANLPRLKVVKLTDAPLTDDGAKGIGMLNQIRVLHVNNASPAGKSPKDSAKVKLTDAGLAELAGCRALRELNLAGTAIKGNGFSAFAKHAYLTEIDLERSSVGPMAFAELKEIPMLRELNLSRTEMTGEGMQALKELQFLGRINLAESKANDAGLKFISLPKSLRDLNLHGTSVTSNGLAMLTDSRLGHLNLNKTKVDVQALKTLSAMKSLRAVYLQGNGWPEKSLQSLRLALPECVVVGQPAAAPSKSGAILPRLPIES